MGDFTTTVRRKGEVDLIAFLRLLWDSKLLVVGIGTLFVLASVFHALTATPIYRASVVVSKVSHGNIGGAASLAGQFGGLVGLNLEQGGPGREAQAILKSRRLTEEFIVRYDLLSALSPAADEPLTLWYGVKHFRELVLTISEDATQGTTTISINWTDPEIAARWANDYVALANEIIRTRAREESERNIKYLNERIEQTSVVGVQRVMYNLIEAETKTLMLANARAEYAFASVDPAVSPEVRSRPKRKLIVLSGGVLGLFFGVVVALTLNIFRQVRAKE